jgi:hypothetical protein
MKSLVFLVLLTIHAFGGEAAGWENPLREKLAKMAADLTASLKPWNVPSRSFEVENHGAVADGVTLNTTTIQKTIDECSTAGGGVVLFSKGDYVTGTLVLKSGVMLEISENSRILGSTDLADYPDHIASRKTVMDTHMKVKQSLIVAEGVERVGLRGPGTIDFRGAKSNFPGNQTIAETPGRPFGMRFIDSKKIVVEHITLTNSACWMQNYLNCEDLIFQKMTVINNANYNNDGIDIDGCRRVILRDCKINSEDDAFCLKGASLRPNEDLLIENSTFYSTCNAFKIGTDTQGDFRRILARNLKLGGIPEDMESSAGHEASSGITLATVDGGAVEDILISNSVIERARCPVFLRVGSRGRLMPGMPAAPIGPLRRIVIENISGDGNLSQGSFISGIKDGVIEDVVIRNYKLGVVGGGTAEMITAPVPESEKGYPDAHQFSRKGLPAFGFYIRHARRIDFHEVSVTPAASDARPVFGLGVEAQDVSLDGNAMAN